MTIERNRLNKTVVCDKLLCVGVLTEKFTDKPTRSQSGQLAD